jgi:ketosteroid isomerase-like protein
MKGRVRSTIAGVVSLVAMCLAIAAQSGSIATDNDSARVQSLESAWNQAEMRHDAQSMSMLLSETFVLTDDDGSLMNKSQWLAHVKSGIDKYDQLTNSGIAVRLYGNVAIATGIYKEKITEKGKGVAHTGRFIDIWIQEKGEWKCVASQATLISN